MAGKEGKAKELKKRQQWGASVVPATSWVWGSG